jgi:hypothetical protein
VDHIQPKIVLKGIKVAVVMQQSVASLHDKGGDETIHCLAYRDTSTAQHPVVFRTLESKINPTERKDCKLKECPARHVEILLVAEALQYFAQDDITKADWPLPGRSMQ